jgi:ABC-type transport system involved in multi-copper enzyme maturation permease subunit
MTLPSSAACYALGGASAEGGIGLLYLVLAATVMQLSTLALFVSERSQSTDTALRTSYALVLVVCVLPLGPYWLIEGDTGPPIEIANWVRCLSPFPAVLEVLGQPGVGTHGMEDRGGNVLRYVLLASVTSLTCAILTIRHLTRLPLDKARPAGVMTQDLARGEKTFRRLLFLVDPRRRSGQMSLWINPIITKEFRTRRFGRSHWTLRLIALSAILSLVLTYIAAAGSLGWGPALIGAVLVLFQMALLLLFAPSLAAGLFSSEREGGGWLLLRTTPLSSGRILRGKLFSVVWPLILLLGATLPGYIVMMSVDPEMAPQARRVVICLVSMAVFSVLVSAACSSLVKTTAAAMAISNIVLITICVGPLLVWLGRDAPFGHQTVEAALAISPIAAALRASESPGFTEYQLLPANWWLLGGASLGLLVLLVVRVRQLYRPE